MSDVPIAHIKIMSFLVYPEQQNAICRWEKHYGTIVEHHHTQTTLTQSINEITAIGGNIIILLGWSSNDATRSAQLLETTRQLLNHRSYIVVLSDTETEQAVVSAHELGADRVIPVKQPIEILNAQLKAICRRIGPGSHLQNFPPYKLNHMTREVFVGDRCIQLTPREFHLAQYLFENHDNIVTRESLLRDIWGLPELQYNRRVDTKISHIRRKMGLDGTYGWLLKFPRGQGYQLLRTALVNT